ncbi:MAG: ribonuclease P protein component [Nitrospira sp. SB0661_bin_20]|nr:ribonuclease P protein component [Nitrospira sp. SB0661_bin_20]
MSDVSSRCPPVFLKKTEDFERVKREGKRITTRFFNVVSCRSGLGNPRVGIVVGRRLGNAVVRNRGKRIFRELVRHTYQNLLQDHDIVVFPKRPALELRHQRLQEIWTTTLISQELMFSPNPSCPPCQGGEMSVKRCVK